MNIMKKYLLAIVCLCLFTGIQAQQKLAVYAGGFYNLENLFDTEDDPDNPGDDEFLPDGPYQWTPGKYQKKLSNMANTIYRLGRDICPAGVAFLAISEVENRRVVEDLVKTEPLAAMNYQFVHYPSPDRRGIDVAFLYNARPAAGERLDGGRESTCDCKSLAIALRRRQVVGVP